MSIVRLENLSHSYNAKKSWAIRDINFEIHNKGVVGFMGSNGAGKSTTMNIMCGVLNQTEGTVEINGVDMKKNPEQAKMQLGFLPQNPPLYLDLTVDEYLAHCAKLRLMDKKEIHRAIEEVKEKVTISHFGKRLLKNLSGGYRQRVGIAQAIIHKPKLVVMDEPTVGLDPNQIIELRTLVKEIGNERVVVFSTHILSEVDTMCKDVVMIENGKIVFSGTIDAFRDIETPDAILATMEAPPSKKELEAIPGIKGVEFLSEKRVRLLLNGARNISESFIELGTERGWRLKEVMFEQKSLDAIFTKLSKQQRLEQDSPIG